MVFGRRTTSKVNLVKEEASSSIPPPIVPAAPQYINVWDSETAKQVTYFIRQPWKWIMDAVAVEGMTEVSSPLELPSEKMPKSVSDAATPATRRRRNAYKKFKGPATLKIEIVTGTEIKFIAHGTSAALDGLEDKDELVRTLQRCRCDHLQISPPSVLIGWDVTHEECLNVVGKSLPQLTLAQSSGYAVLKEPMGTQGQGIYFVQGAEEIHKVIDEHRQRALIDPDYLDNLIEVKGRIPSWVLQAEVSPPLLIKDRRKFHIRSYIVVLENQQSPNLCEIFLFSRQEVRIAGVPVSENDLSRERLAHITNGALSPTTQCVLLDDVDELMQRDLKKKTEVFVATTFGTHLLPDLTRRIKLSRSENNEEVLCNGVPIRNFAIAGLDIMVTGDNQIYLLEVNVDPTAPSKDIVDDAFSDHLKIFMRCMVDLVVGKPVPEFLSLKDILVREGLAD